MKINRYKGQVCASSTKLMRFRLIRNRIRNRTRKRFQKWSSPFLRLRLYERGFKSTRLHPFYRKSTRFGSEKHEHENDLSVFSAVTSWPRHVFLPEISDLETIIP